MGRALSRFELIRKLRRLGFSGPYSGGRHQFMIKGALKLRIPNPHDGDVSKDLESLIRRQAGIERDDWDKA